MDIGSKIRDLREDADLSQKEISAMIPMNQSNYSKIERNVQEPSLFQLKRIAEILHIDLNKLFEIEDKSDPYTKDIIFARKIKKLYEDTYND
ncbi:MAG: helix-turn-helix transcriptional regulator [Clostridia bacterium]|nr:helix-turn-helix transcriptional regulator [Clostridia bacterium]MBQ7117542.1 helix-turn-helix transcriptional regulator [Clostridia bacterium]